jgi:hypothetical protein
MIKEPSTVLGINPGTRYLAIAVLRNHNLLEWRMKTFNGGWSKKKPTKAEGVISDFIKIYQPDVIAVKAVHPSRGSDNLKKVLSKILEITREHRIKSPQFSIKEVESFLAPGRRINKSALSELVVSEFPILQPELQREQQNKSCYYVRIFEAVAIAYLAQQGEN